jgi:hypothetical protein
MSSGPHDHDWKEYVHPITFANREVYSFQVIRYCRCGEWTSQTYYASDKEYYDPRTQQNSGGRYDPRIS